MGKREKGRKHRRVNRTPRPVSRAGTDRSAQRSGGAPVPGAVADGQGSVMLPPHERAGAGGAGAEPERSVFVSRADGGLGYPAQRTWSALRAAGARESGVEELCAVVGFTQRTVLKHLEGLAAHGLAVQGAGGGWAAAGAARGLPDPRPGTPALAGSAR